MQEEYNRRLAEWHAENRRRQEATDALLLREAEQRVQQPNGIQW